MNQAGRERARTSEWDDANRLKAIVEGTKRFEFTYDGLGRRYKMVYKTNGVTTFTRRFIWCGAQPCWESANVTGQPGTVKRYFAQGVLEGSDKYFSMRDHLGSVREVMKNNSSTVEARYDYDPWGRQTQTTGTRVFDIGYAGYMVFAPTGTNIKLNLTWYRAYSPELGRWLSRDPIGEKGGINLYGYVNNRPVNTFDWLGLESYATCIAACDIAYDLCKKGGKSNAASYGGGVAVLGTAIVVVGAAIGGAMEGGVAGAVAAGPLGAVAGAGVGAVAGLGYAVYYYDDYVKDCERQRQNDYKRCEENTCPPPPDPDPFRKKDHPGDLLTNPPWKPKKPI